jgi:hypothetical protein
MHSKSGGRVELKIDKYVIFSILFCLGCLSVNLTSMAVYAQSPNASSQPTVSLPAYIWEGPVPGGYITGYVLDEDGNPVPDATVSLLLDGQLWKPSKYSYPDNRDNPQTTRIAYHDTEGFLQEGSFLFGLPIPDEYTLTAEKDGYKGSASVHVGRDTRVITVNITLSGYRQPTFSPEQLSYTGAIAGEIRGDQGYPVGANVSLWQDGRMVKMPDNPQSTLKLNYSGQRVDYIFEHLAPGNYTVMAEYWVSGNIFDSKTVSIEVGTRPMRADMVVPRAKRMPTGYPDISFTPTVGEFLASESRPTPALSGLLVLLAIGTVAYFMHKKFEKR